MQPFNLQTFGTDHNLFLFLQMLHWRELLFESRFVKHLKISSFSLFRTWNPDIYLGRSHMHRRGKILSLKPAPVVADFVCITRACII